MLNRSLLLQSFRLNPSVRAWCNTACIRSITTQSRPSLAILDDYLDIAKPHFTHIPSSQLSITTFHDTLPAFNHPHTTPTNKQALIDRLKPFTIISCMRERTPFPGDLLRALPNLKLLLATGTQFETFDLKTASHLGIRVAAAPGRGLTDGRLSARPPRPRLDIKKGGNHPTTQHAWALILALARNVAADDAAMKGPAKGWQSRLALGLTGATLGVVGLGRLGAAVARVASLAWGMRVLCWSENLTQEKADRKAEEVGVPVYGGYALEPEAPTFRAVGKAELFRAADVVSLHYVLSERSRGIVGRRELTWMRGEAILVNTSRGALVDDVALFEALESGRIRGAALDVFDVEPLPVESPWRSTKWGTQGRSNLVITPHMGYVEEGIMHTWYEETAENLERWLRGDSLLHSLN
ncbi:glycerate dehydrogenase [Annulohypoxylon maeteangense]|uniref:glycerate dehydrogenase n=1 Tax=Annulohypoxylon maeteangense TaxID=1927788 RepID=UPI002008BE73|nr:glycerate dehydrogenase [Annulohypoxylon maeteangense]KAI0886821.1 glycerate dehydrogenase [Annulohypoxylon maeteangense]